MNIDDNFDIIAAACLFCVAYAVFMHILQWFWSHCSHSHRVCSFRVHFVRGDAIFEANGRIIMCVNSTIKQKTQNRLHESWSNAESTERKYTAVTASELMQQFARKNWPFFSYLVVFFIIDFVFALSQFISVVASHLTVLLFRRDVCARAAHTFVFVWSPHFKRLLKIICHRFYLVHNSCHMWAYEIIFLFFTHDVCFSNIEPAATR